MSRLIEERCGVSAERLPPLRAGDHLDQPVFHARYEQTPRKFKAELLKGRVFVPSPLSFDHGEYHGVSMGWGFVYAASTPGVHNLDNPTIILDGENEPQPDLALLLEPDIGGQTRVVDRYVRGAPEHITEIAFSSESYDLFEKRDAYREAGVLEYVVVLLRERAIRWLVRGKEQYIQMQPDADGVYRSRVFPGLWLHEQAYLALDGAAVLKTLQQGIESEAHAEYVQMLEKRRTEQ